jgi:hypothetical protein
MTTLPGGAEPSGDEDAEDLVETQVERTELAWARTSLACAGLAAIWAHVSVGEVGPVLALALGALVAMPGLVASWWRIRGLRASPEPEPPRAAGAALLAGSVALVDVVVLLVLAT